MNEEIAKTLCDAHVLKTGRFEMASGAESPVYVDLRILPSYPKVFDKITELFSKLVQGIGVDVAAGAETAGIPLATAVSLKTKLPMIYVRRRPKGYGTDSMIEGILEKGQKVVLIDDLITNGGSKMRFIDGIRKAGGNIKNVAVILDREQGGKEFLAEEDIELHSLITLKELLGYMKQHSLIEKEKYLEIMEYLSENEQNN